MTETLAEAYAGGATLRELAAEHGVDNTTVLRWLRSQDAETRRTGPRGRVDVTDEQLVELRGMDLSYEAVAAAVGMSKTGVRARFRRMEGLPRYGQDVGQKGKR